MMPVFYSAFIARYVNPKMRNNQIIIVLILAILAFRVYNDHSSLFGVGYYIFGGICTYIAASIFVGAINDIRNEAKEVEGK